MSVCSRSHLHSQGVTSRRPRCVWSDIMRRFWVISNWFFLLLQVYLDFQEKFRNSVFSSLSRKHHGIGPLLIKIEGLVVYTNTGKSPRLRQYYAYWEKRIFESLVKVQSVTGWIRSFHNFRDVTTILSSHVLQMVANNLTYFKALLQSDSALFTVEALLSTPEIILHPHANELFKLMSNVMRDIVEGYV